MISHFLPYALFAAAGLGSWLPPQWRLEFQALCTVAAGVSLIVFARRGQYPELGRDAPPRTARGTGLAIAAGVAVYLTWMPLTVIVPPSPLAGSRGWFLPEAAGPVMAPWIWAAKLLAMVVVVPFLEELLVRSLIPRWTDAMDGWRKHPVGAFTRTSAGVSIAFFVVTHPEWLAALVTGLLWTGLLAKTRRLGDAVLAHAIANGLLSVVWLHTGDRSWW